MLRTSLLLALTLALGCSVDADGDGYKAKDDCDDLDASVNPGANEVCDGVDNDCDGEVDEGLTGTYYADEDGDGYGDPEASSTACSAPSGYVDNPDDCDDTRADIHPGAAETDCTDPTDYNCDGSVGYADLDGDGVPACEDCDDSDPSRSPNEDEVCDGVDNDCDGAVDDSAVDAPTWYLDHDLDGYGDPGVTVEDCSDPGDYWVDNDGDCNDLAATAYPGADEVCDEIDNDCDGLVDVEDPDILDATTLYVDADEDGYGVDGSATLACADQAGYIDVPGDCDDSDAEVNPDAQEICNNGVDDDCDGGFDGCTMDLGDSDVIYYGESANDSLGSAIAGAGDLNADGFDDIVMGAVSADPDGDGASEGTAYIVWGPLTVGSYSASTLSTRITGVATDDEFGKRVAGPGDMTGDGVPEVVIGATQYDGGSKTNNGGIFIFSGDSLGTVEHAATDALAIYYDSTSYDWLGAAVEGAGDVNGDGLADVIVGASGEDMGGGNSGAVFLIYGSTTMSGSQTVFNVQPSIYGESGDYLGTSIGAAGDVDGDGYDDVLVGHKSDSDAGTNAGAVYVFLGPVSGNNAATDADAILYGTSAGDYLGEGLGAFEDANGDGYDDILVSATMEDGGTVDGGAVYVIDGTADIATAWNGMDPDSVASAKIVGETKDGRFGRKVDGTGDNDGDGANDLIIGSSSAGDAGEGAVWIFYGPISGDYTASDAAATFTGSYNEDHAGSDVNFVGDVDGTGRDALGIAAVDGSAGGTNAGAVYFIIDVGL